MPFRPAAPDSLTPVSAIDGVSEIFDPTLWDEVPGFEDLTDLTYHYVVSPRPGRKCETCGWVGEEKA